MLDAELPRNLTEPTEDTMARPDFFLVGAPKAGTTALHAALADHPQLFLSAVKEPKFYLCDGTRPTGFGRLAFGRPAFGQRGPGDAHSAQEWMWQRGRYAALFDAAPPGAQRGESTPFYLYDRQAHRRIHDDVPEAKLIAVIRDPIDRAYSNWMHAWSDGLEPIGDFVEAVAREDERIAQGWAPFWHYRRLGLYGEQLRDLVKLFGRDQVHVLRYRDLVETPKQALDAVCAFLGVPAGVIPTPARENSRPYVAPSIRTRTLARVVRAGAAAGAYAPPQLWRQLSRPLLTALQRGDALRPTLAPDVRMRLVEFYRDDNALLTEVTGRDFSDWLGASSRGQFVEKQVNRVLP